MPKKTKKQKQGASVRRIQTSSVIEHSPAVQPVVYQLPHSIVPKKKQTDQKPSVEDHQQFLELRRDIMSTALFAIVAIIALIIMSRFLA